MAEREREGASASASAGGAGGTMWTTLLAKMQDELSQHFCNFNVGGSSDPIIHHACSQVTVHTSTAIIRSNYGDSTSTTLLSLCLVAESRRIPY